MMLKEENAIVNPAIIGFNKYPLQKYKNPIARIDFKSRTPYKFWDSTLNGNNATLYRPEWGDLF